MLKAYYRCRLCGEEFYSLDETDDPEKAVKAIRQISQGSLFTKDFGVMDFTISHYCKDGSIGVADMLGFDFKEEEE